MNHIVFVLKREIFFLICKGFWNPFYIFWLKVYKLKHFQPISESTSREPLK